MVKIVTHILFATDFSPCSSPAFRHAVDWATLFEAELTLFHGLSLQPGLDIDAGIAQRYLDEQRKAADQQLRELQKEATKHVPQVTIEVRNGLASAQIVSLARERKADLIITGTHGWAGLNRVIFGSVAERTIQQAPCPVLTVPDRSPEKAATLHVPTIRPKRIILPLDFSECSINAYEYGVQIAKWCDASLTLVYAIEPLSYSLDFSLTHPLKDKANRKKIELRLKNLTEVLIKDGLSAQYELSERPALEGILRVCASQEADLLIMGTHARKGVPRLIIGSTTAKVLQQSPYPILTVKSQKFERPVAETK